MAASSPVSRSFFECVRLLAPKRALLYVVLATAAAGCGPASVSAQQASGGALPGAALDELRAEVRKYAGAAPNHSCTLRIQRLQERRSVGQMMEENASVEVAYIGGRERFSWPGEAVFRDDELRDILVMGLSGSGSFAEHLRSVVLGEDTEFISAKETESANGPVRVIRYRVPAGRSGYLVNLDGREIEAAIQGEIVAQVPRMAVIAFALEAVDLPGDFPVTAVEERIRFAATNASGAFRVPVEASQRMVEGGTDTYTNRVEFIDCKEFRGDSVVRFEQGSGSETAADAAGAAAPLPAGVPMEIRLKSAITWGKVRTGDPVEAELSRPLKFTGQLLANAGARVLGRVVELKRISTYAGSGHLGNPPSVSGYLVGLQFDAIEGEGRRIPAVMVLDTLTDMPKSNRRGIAAAVRGETAPYEVLNRVRPDGRPYPRAGFIRVSGDSGGLPAGLSMRWVSEESDGRR